MQRRLFSSENRDFPLKTALLPTLFLPVIGVIILSGCEDTRPRVYTEVAFKPLTASQGMGGPMAGMGNMERPAGLTAAPIDVKVTWTLPEGWVVKDSANAMRIGSFAAMDPALAHTGDIDPNAVDVSVVRLAGDAGGLEANIARWMGQVGIKPTTADMEGLIKAAAHFKAATGQEGMYVDLTEMLSGDMTQNKTIFGAVVQTSEYTVFVKAMGEFARVAKQKDNVKAFCKSLRIEGPKS